MATALAMNDRAARQGIRDVIGLFKLRIGILIMITALVGLAVSPGPAPGFLQVITVAFTVLMASASAGAFNQYYESDSDALMARTRRRAFVTGALVRSPAWLLLIGAMLAGSVGLAAYILNPASALYVFLGAFFYAIVYTVWLKRRTWLNIVIGGLAGSFAVLAGAAAVDPGIGAQPALLAVVLFLWTPPHFWSLAIAHQDDYVNARIPMLPVLIGPVRAARIVFYNTAALVAVSALPVFYGAGPIYAIGAIAGGLHFLVKTWALARAPGPETARRAFLASLIQLSVLLIAASIDSISW
jgi:protoheme IX farnesyltransferase